MRRAEIIHDDGKLRLAVSRNLLVVVWYDAPEVQQLRAFHKAGLALATKLGDPPAYFSVVVAGKPRFTDEVRAELVRIMRDPVQPRAVAHSIELGGLMGTAVRAFLNTAMLLARPRTPQKLFGDRLAAAAWAAQQLSAGREAWTPAEVSEVVGEVVRRSAPVVA